MSSDLPNRAEATSLLASEREKFIDLACRTDERVDVVAILAIENKDGSMSYDISARTHCPSCTLAVMNGALESLQEKIKAFATSSESN